MGRRHDEEATGCHLVHPQKTSCQLVTQWRAKPALEVVETSSDSACGDDRL